MFKIKSQYSIHRLTALTALTLAVSYTPIAPAQGLPSTPPAINIQSCSVRTTGDTDKTYDCSAEVAKACNGQPTCELQIGYNLTAGKDIDPSSGFEGKLVTVVYDCGVASPVSRQRGPYNQNDHATLLLDCFML